MKTFPNTAWKYICDECIKPFKWAFLGCLLLVLAETGAYNMQNWFLAEFIDIIKETVSEKTLYLALLTASAIVLCNIFIAYLPKLVLIFRQKHLYFPVRERILTRALRYIFGHSVNYIVNKQTGTLLAKMNQISSTDQIFSVLIVIFWSMLCEMSIKTILLMTINIYLGLLFVVLCFLVAVLNYFANRPSERLSKMENKAASIYEGWLVDTIANIRLVKDFDNVGYEQNRLSVLLRQFIAIKAKSMITWFASYTFVGIFIYVCSVTMLALAVYLWYSEQISVGGIVFVLTVVDGGFKYLMELCIHFRRLKNNLAGIQSGLEPFCEEHEIKDIADAKVLKLKAAEIEFKDVCFAYPDRTRIFDKFNLKIHKGERVGIVGLSGNGKTTLVNLLLRAYEIQDGQILINGEDIRNFTQESLHGNMAVIAQDAVLFHRSLLENISYGIDNPDIRKVKRAAKTAYADEFIKKQPQKYDTVVGDRGCRLSGGERQRIAIARAVLRNSPILILDEATSALDSESEHIVSQAVNNLLGRRTVIAIAHRLSTLKEMDRIVYLEQGRIVEEGGFEQLTAKKGGKFAHLWRLQQSEER